MKTMSIEIKAIISALLLFGVALNRSAAQGKVETNAEALKFSQEIESRVGDFETNAWDIETNASILDSQKAMDKDWGGAQNSIEAATVTLEFFQAKIGRKERTILWFELFAGLERHLLKTV